MDEKQLTIKQAKNEIKHLENEIDVYLTQRNINFLKTQPKAMQLKDLVVDSSHTNLDCFLDYISKDEEYDFKIYGLLASIYAYKNYIAKELQRMSEYDEIGYIVYLKENEKKSWKEIDKLLHHGEDYSRTKYKRHKKMVKISNFNNEKK